MLASLTAWIIGNTFPLLAGVGVFVGTIILALHLSKARPWTTEEGRTRLSLLVGIAVSVILAIVFSSIAKEIVESSFSQRDLKIFRWLLPVPLGVALTALIVVPGFFPIEPGYKGFLRVLGRPWFKKLSFGTGWGWRLPLLSSMTIEVTKANSFSLEASEYATGAGIPLTLKSGAVFEIQDPLLAQNIEGGDVENFLRGKLPGAVQAFLLKQKKNSPLKVLATIQSTAPGQLDMKVLLKAIASFTVFKGNIATTGPAAIAEIINKGDPDPAKTGDGAEDYGVKVTQVMLEKLLLPAKMEEKIQQLYDELFEKLALQLDAETKKRFAKTLMTLYEDSKIDFVKLGQAGHAELISTALDRALAQEGKANFHHHAISGKSPPRGFFFGGGAPDNTN